MASSTGKSAATVFRAIVQGRRTCKRFQPGRKIPSEILSDVLTSTVRSPSSFNLQPMQVVLVQNTDLLKELAEECMLGPGNQFRTQQCSALAVFLADLEASKRIDRIQELEKDQGVRHPNYRANLPVTASFLLGEGHLATALKTAATNAISSVAHSMPTPEPVETWAYKNTALSVQSYVLASESYQLQTAVMEGFDARRCRRILRIPDRYGIPMIVATGYEYEPDTSPVTPRLPLEEVVFGDTFGSPLNLVAGDKSVNRE